MCQLARRLAGAAGTYDLPPLLCVAALHALEGQRQRLAVEPRLQCEAPARGLVAVAHQVVAEEQQLVPPRDRHPGLAPALVVPGVEPHLATVARDDVQHAHLPAFDEVQDPLDRAVLDLAAGQVRRRRLAGAGHPDERARPAAAGELQARGRQRLQQPAHGGEQLVAVPEGGARVRVRRVSAELGNPRRVVLAQVCCLQLLLEVAELQLLGGGQDVLAAGPVADGQLHHAEPLPRQSLDRHAGEDRSIELPQGPDHVEPPRLRVGGVVLPQVLVGDPEQGPVEGLDQVLLALIVPGDAPAPQPVGVQPRPELAPLHVEDVHDLG
mmetsp:Transcript_15692/g.44806  ORF Transcript_15692/g.44806 Transcript_15692/m.44806 type:complete len:324 (+) Transcript_15692:2787-3758(+)